MLMYADGNHHGCGYEPSDQPNIIDTIRARLAARTPFERVWDELEDKRWTHDEATALKAKIDAGLKQPWEYCQIAASIERCPVATYICTKTECRQGCTLDVAYPSYVPAPEAVTPPAELTITDRLVRLFKRS